MKTKIISLMALATGLAVPVAVAQSTPPVLTVAITDIGVTDGTISGLEMLTYGQGYTANPTVTLQFGGGSGAAFTATESGGSVNNIIFGSGGSGYIGAPTVTFSGGQDPSSTTPPTQATALAILNIATDYPTPYQNEVSGPAGRTIIMGALASGTHPASGFKYTFTANGEPIGQTVDSTPPGSTGYIGWTPPLPGVYSLVATTDDGANNATSQAVRYFATGTAIVSPVAGSGGSGPPASPGSLVPVGSSLVIQATSTPADGFVQRIDFYTDWNNGTSSGTLIGSSTNYPYSIIYTPAGAPGAVHIVKAIAYDNTNTAVPSIGLDEIVLTMTTANSGPLPTCTIVSPRNNSLVEIPDYASNGAAAINVLVTAGPGTGSGAHIQRVELYINGVLFATDTAFPYNFSWKPTVTGAYALTALAYDTLGNVVASTSSSSGTGTPAPTNVTIESAPTVDIISPGQGATLNGGAATSITAVAVDTNLDSSGNPVAITQVQFFQDGTFIGVATPPPTGNLYTVSFKPVQNMVNGQPAPSQLTAIATDTAGFSGVAAGVQVNVTSGGTGSNVVIGVAPTVTLTAPLDQASVVVNTPVTLAASGTAPNGNIASMAFLVDNAVIATLAKYPYSTTWTFQNLGTYQVIAQVTDNVGDQTSTKAITVNVVPEPPPTVTITSPTSGGIVSAAAGVTVTASASSPAGTIASVQFFENNLPIGTATSAPYTASFTPLSAGVYTLTAIVTDNSGEQTTSAPSIVEAVPSAGGLGTTVYFGNYQGITGDPGRFAFAVVDGTYGTYIAHSTPLTGGASTIAYYPDLKVSSGGNFSTASLTGTASVTGVSGSLLPSQAMFIGAATNSSGQSVASGYYTGNLGGQAGSSVTGIVGPDGSIMLYVNSGTAADVGDGSVDSTGAFTITTAGGNTLTGKLDPATGFLGGTITGPAGGSILAARVSGGTFSDGVLRNLSTRGYVGTGGSAMIAGFVVGGTSPKTLLIRAIGPTLANFGLAGAIPSTSLQIYSGTTLVNSNAGWSSNPANATAVATAEPQVGAFALPAGSADSALVGTFAPGSYTAVIQGLGGATGVALVEAYDLDAYTPFTSKKLINVSTRGTVGSGTNVMIGGFLVNGAAPKRLLIRGAGPGLAALGVTGALATPHLQLINSATQAVIRENYSWQMGNDPGLVTTAEQVAGAFPYANGSADSAILIVLPPGTYTAVLSGAGSSTGTALTEVYEVP